MTLVIKEIAPGEYLLNPGSVGPFAGETLLLEFNSPRLQPIIKMVAENYTNNLANRKTTFKFTFLLVGLICKIDYRDYEVCSFFKEKREQWEKLGYRVAFMPPFLRNPSHQVRKSDPRDRDGLRRTKEPPVMYAYLGHDSIVSRITLSDELVNAKLIEPNELYGE